MPRSSQAVQCFPKDSGVLVCSAAIMQRGHQATARIASNVLTLRHRRRDATLCGFSPALGVTPCAGHADQARPCGGIEACCNFAAYNGDFIRCEQDSDDAQVALSVQLSGNTRHVTSEKSPKHLRHRCRELTQILVMPAAASRQALAKIRTASRRGDGAQRENVAGDSCGTWWPRCIMAGGTHQHAGILGKLLYACEERGIVAPASPPSRFRRYVLFSVLALVADMPPLWPWPLLCFHSSLRWWRQARNQRAGRV